VVIESASRGGSLITAEIANSYSRDVFAVPGKLNDTYSKGCNYLIRSNKAALVTSSDDIKYIMGWENESKIKKPVQRKLFIDFTNEEKILVDILKETEESSIDYLCSQSKLGMSKVASALLNLEFEGVVRNLPGKLYILV
jgi:DNA processing protein